MIISHSRRYVFIHVPKTGGTTVEKLLAPTLVAERDIHVSRAATLVPPSGTAASFQGGGKHAVASLVRRQLGNATYDAYFSFAFSRNPYARCYSAYRFMMARTEMDARRAEKGLAARKDRRPDRRADPARIPALSFDDICSDLATHARNFPLLQPQTKWLKRLDSVDFVGRLENLNEDLDFIFDQIGLPKDGLENVTPANQKTAPSEWRGMSTDAAARIRAFYASDFAQFGYDLDFDAPDHAPPRSLRNRNTKRGDHGLISRFFSRIRSAVAS